MFNIKLTTKFFKDIAETLLYIHSKGFLYNYLKTDNLIIHRGHADEFCPVIIGFGKCKEQVNVEGYKRRTDANYIAPEANSGEPESTASDLYAFGSDRGGSCWPDEVFRSLFSRHNFKHFSIDPFSKTLRQAVSLLFARLSTKIDTKQKNLNANTPRVRGNQ